MNPRFTEGGAVGRCYRSEVLRSCEDPWADPASGSSWAGLGGRSDRASCCGSCRSFPLCGARAEAASEGSSSAILLQRTDSDSRVSQAGGRSCVGGAQF